MKIVYISSSTIPSRMANSVHVMKMCQALAHNGHEVVLIAPDKKNGVEPNVDDVFKYYGVERNFKLERVAWLNLKGRSYLYGLLAAQATLKYKPDLVFCRNLVGCFFATILKKSVIFESHTPILASGKVNHWFFERLIRKKELKEVVVITESLRYHYQEQYSKLLGKVRVFPDGADPIDLRNKRAEPSEHRRLQVGYVGHLYAGRGVDIIIGLAGACEWADFHIIGGTECDIEYWKKQSYAKNLTFHGFVSPAVAENLRLECDVLLAPYQNDVAVSGGGGNTVKWMSPLKVFEYMAAGKVILCSDLPVLREVLTDGVNSLLCRPDDLNDWVIKLRSINDNEELRLELAQNALNDLESNYTWFARAKNIING